jgi:hypothetical protein
MCSRPPHQQRPFAAGLNRRHVAGQDARRLVANTEDRTMNGDQCADCEPVLQLGGGNTRSEQFLPGHDPVGLARQVPKDFFDCPVLGS